MTHLGIFTIFAHYPNVSADLRRMSPKLRHLIESEVGRLSRITITGPDAPDTAAPAEACSAWLFSGTGLMLNDREIAQIENFVRTAAAAGPVLAIWHAEHVLHRALALPGTPAPGTRPFPFSVRNPVAQFGASDQLFRWSGPDLGLVPCRGAMIAAPERLAPFNVRPWARWI